VPQKIVLLWFWAVVVCAQDTGRPLWQPFRITPRTDSQHVSLDGRWQLSYRDQVIRSTTELAAVRWIDARVPSSVHWALFESGEPPHPYNGLNADKYEWVDEKVWY